MSADDLAALDLAPIRARLALDDDFRFLARAREDIAALLLEIERLRAENTALWETLVSDPDEELAQLGADFVKEWCDGL